MTAAEARRAKVAAALVGAAGCPAEWTGGDGNTHLCNLLGLADHRHMCSCGEVAPEADGGAAGLVCPSCGGGAFVLQLGGRASGAVSCSGCGLVLDAGGER